MGCAQSTPLGGETGSGGTSETGGSTGTRRERNGRDRRTATGGVTGTGGAKGGTTGTGGTATGGVIGTGGAKGGTTGTGGTANGRRDRDGRRQGRGDRDGRHGNGRSDGDGRHGNGRGQGRRDGDGRHGNGRGEGRREWHRRRHRDRRHRRRRNRPLHGDDAPERRDCAQLIECFGHRGRSRLDDLVERGGWNPSPPSARRRSARPGTTRAISWLASACNGTTPRRTTSSERSTRSTRRQRAGSGGGYSYIGIYGWSVSPCVEWYIVDDSYNKMPVNPGSTTNKGTATIDGGTYTLYTRPTSGTGGSKCSGVSSWTQFYSVRQTARQCGQISISRALQGVGRRGHDAGEDGPGPDPRGGRGRQWKRVVPGGQRDPPIDEPHGPVVRHPSCIGLHRSRRIRPRSLGRDRH